MQAKKREFLQAIRSGKTTLVRACEVVGKDPATVWRWRQADPDFDTAFLQATEQSDGIRVALVEDSVFGRILGGKASAAETIFFLVNRGRGRWRHVQRADQPVPPTRLLIPIEVIRAAIREADEGDGMVWTPDASADEVTE